ncbi:hypothetical protein VPH35_134268 [Triticum aestivum]|uniref:G-type lectin S-receptor-like serine/threonine-protein kinase LECRK3 n=1 Tax=Triticum aestivum TaxID=4565 RepID=UPI001D00FECC|nr:G-type lectin S-receptor-like serine/threonine-protein kinase LECRK3 [Triticum aestivum]
MPPAALPSFALLRVATSIAMLLVQQARLLPVAVARTKLTAGDTPTVPDYITSRSGSFAFGFRAHDSDPTKFLLATWFRFGSVPPQAQSVVWFAKESAMGTTPNATARSVLSIPADGQLTLTDGSIELWRAPTPSMKRGSVLVLTDFGNVQLLGDGDNVLWESFGFPTDTLLPGQSLEGFLFSKRAYTGFTTGRFSLAAHSDGNVVLCIDLFTGDILQNAYWATATNGPYGNTTITFDEYGHLSYTLYDGSINNLISPLATGRNYFRFARMDPDGIVRAYTHPKHGGGGGQNTTWTVSGTLPSAGGCKLKTTRMQGMCGPGSYCVETKERLNCLCPSGYTYIDAEHIESGCTPGFEAQRCGEENIGMIRSPQPHLIAVQKLIDSNEYNEQEFTNEVQSIGQIHHLNLVRMISYCKQGKHRMLVFEFMPGGSLRGFLFKPERRQPWRWRAEAALAIARGLEYLHNGCIAPIIHRDIKPDNILFDYCGIPNITDFGISKLLGSQHQLLLLFCFRNS